jgi:diadenosine tetraphosphate (Ap4A) HIT family hydrolase
MLSGIMRDFILDSRLAADTVPIAELELCSLRLMNDCRWPWLVLVPRLADAIELHDLSEADQARLFHETVLAGRVLKSVTGCEKINTGALGNIVRQLHVHVVARSPGDPNWPGPVWGQGLRIVYETSNIEALSKRIRMEIGGVS